MGEFRRIKRELAYQGTIMKIYKDYVEVNGKQAVWDFFHHNGGAAVVPVTKEGKILMVRQYRNAIDRFTLEIPAGAFDTTNESGATCVARELEEETGYKAGSVEWLITIRSMVAFCNEKVEIFVGNHVWNNATREKAEQISDDFNPFINEKEWIPFIDDCIEKIKKLMVEEP